MQFDFATAGRILFGAGSLSQLAAAVKGFGRRALVVCGRSSARGNPLLSQLQAAQISASIFSVQGEPDIATVEAGVALARGERCEFVISFGGGSVIDAGKAIAAMMTNEGSLLDYLEVVGRAQVLKNLSAPFVAIPTTAGTGSEVTRNAVLASPEHHVKVSLRSPFMLARLALVDPELSYDLPPDLTASTGLDALTQLIEPYVCNRANAMTDSVCGQGLQRAAKSLRKAVFNGQDKAAREDMAMASLFGGLALANAGLGAVHGFAGPIGGMFPAPHGAVCAALLPHVMAANLTAMTQRDPANDALRRYDQIATFLTGTVGAAAGTGVDWVRQLVADLPVQLLRAYGIRDEHVPDIVVKAAQSSSMKANPIVLTADELANTLRAAL